MNQHLAEGSLLSSDLAWEEGMPDWVPLSQIPGVGEPATPAAPARTVPGGRKKLFLGLGIGASVLAVVAILCFVWPGF